MRFLSLSLSVSLSRALSSYTWIMTSVSLRWRSSDCMLLRTTRGGLRYSVPGEWGRRCAAATSFDSAYSSTYVSAHNVSAQRCAAASSFHSAHSSTFTYNVFSQMSAAMQGSHVRPLYIYILYIYYILYYIYIVYIHTYIHTYIRTYIHTYRWW